MQRTRAYLITTVGLILLTTLTAFAAALGTTEGEAAQAPPAPDLNKDPTLYVVGYAHLDTQWRWTYAQTVKQFIPDTLKGNFALFEKYPHYVFNFSGSRRYEMMLEYYPDDYARLKKEIAAGRWFPCGSSVDENDANVPSAESFVRHVLYGNRFFRREFGVASDEFMLPDCFGFPAALPSMLAHCGVIGFSTQKLTWGGVVPIPFKVGVWEGPDGRGVIAALDPGAYVGLVKENLAKSEGWLKRINENGKKSGVFVDYHYFGIGDQGGAPVEPSVQKVEESVKTTDGTIRVISAPADHMFKAITPEMRTRLPRYKGELLLTEHSAGSISSQAYMKRWNRKNELLADAAERASVAAWWLGGRDYPSRKLYEGWDLVLGSQMHDILPGTSVPKAYDFSWNDEVLAANLFGATLEDSASAVSSALDTRGRGTCIVVFNPLSVEREDVVETTIPTGGAAIKGVKATGPAGETVAAQILDSNDKELRIAFVAKVPPVGFAAFDVETLTDAAPAATSTLRASERELANDRYTVRLDDNGDVSSIFDREANRELLSAPARIGLHYENPRNWPAWNQDWADRQLPAKSFAAAPATFKVVEQGPVRVAVEVTREAEGSIFTQRIRLAAGAPGARVEFATQIDWRTRERSVRAAFPLSVANPKATYDIQTGTVERGNGHEKQYEYPFHHWFDLTDVKGDYGVTVMCDSKYAADKPDDRTVRLTLLHTPGTRGGFPDQGTQDIGRHNVLYAVQGHASDWRAGQSYIHALGLNQPLVPFRATAHPGSLGKAFSLFRVSDSRVTISAIKKSEDGDEVIVRLREHTGALLKGIRIAANKPIAAAREVDGQEREIARAALTDGELVTDMGGFELRAFALKLGPAPATVAKIESKPLALPFDTDVVSTNANRADGAFDDAGRTLPAEQLPASITSEGVTFSFGPTADGQKNAVTCRGQELKLPEGGFDRIILLAASDGDATTSVSIGKDAAPLTVQSWRGFIGQWDRREWPGNVDDFKYDFTDAIVGLTPGFVKPDSVAWYASHFHTKTADSYYEFCQLFKYTLDLPPDAHTIRLPDDPRVKVLAASVAKIGPARAVAAHPLFDTLENHQPDAPRIVSAGGPFDDSTDVRIEPTLYWRDGAIRYTTDGSPLTPQSPAYAGPITLNTTKTLTAAVLGPDGKLGPVATQRIDVDDRKPPRLARIEANCILPIIRLDFAEPVHATAADISRYVLTSTGTDARVRRAELSPDARSAILQLTEPLKPGASCSLEIRDVKDTSPRGNAIDRQAFPFTPLSPVFQLTAVTPDQMGKTQRDISGLPTRADDPWTLNLFVRTVKQPDNRTVIAGFGQCEDKKDGAARYICKFANGIHFWSRLRDVGSRTALDLNRWQMLTATYDGRVLRLYKDAEKIGESAVELADDINAISIAPKDPWEQKRQFEGEIRDLSIWNAALGADAIAALKNAAESSVAPKNAAPAP